MQIFFHKRQNSNTSAAKNTLCIVCRLKVDEGHGRFVFFTTVLS